MTKQLGVFLLFLASAVEAIAAPLVVNQPLPGFSVDIPRGWPQQVVPNNVSNGVQVWTATPRPIEFGFRQTASIRCALAAVPNGMQFMTQTQINAGHPGWPMGPVSEPEWERILGVTKLGFRVNDFTQHASGADMARTVIVGNQTQRMQAAVQAFNTPGLLFVSVCATTEFAWPALEPKITALLDSVRNLSPLAQAKNASPPATGEQKQADEGKYAPPPSPAVNMDQVAQILSGALKRVWELSE
jgi:hypothetical protein